MVNVIAIHEKRQMTAKMAGNQTGTAFVLYIIMARHENSMNEGGGVVAGKQSGTAVAHFYLSDWWSNSRIWGAGKRSGTEFILFLCLLALFGNRT